MVSVGVGLVVLLVAFGVPVVVVVVFLVSSGFVVMVVVVVVCCCVVCLLFCLVLRHSSGNIRLLWHSCLAFKIFLFRSVWSSCYGCSLSFPFGFCLSLCVV